MKSDFNPSSEPNIVRDEKGNVTHVNHNHYRAINYRSYELDDNLEALRQVIDESRIAIKGCMAFFKVIKEDKNADVLLRATATCAFEEDRARLKDFEDHKASIFKSK